MRFIGRKTLLLEDIEKLINDKAPDAKSFCDIFSGSTTVSKYFKKNFKIISNDLLYFSYVLQRGTIKNNSIPNYKKLKEVLNISDPIIYINNIKIEEMEKLPVERRFFQNTYSPIGERMYMTSENALRIDYARNLIEFWLKNSWITRDEYYYLLSCLIEGIPFISNISGTYGAFHKKWDKRALGEFKLVPLEVYNNYKDNECFNEDGVQLLQRISGDILYIDPPYNGRQYSSNYHVLETAAKYDFPEVKGITGQRIQNIKSKFCMKSKVLSEFEKLIQNAQFNHIIVSYSTDGLMNLQDIECIMKKYGNPETFEIKKIPYRRYKNKRKSKKSDDLIELLIYIEKRF